MRILVPNRKPAATGPAMANPIAYQIRSGPRYREDLCLDAAAAVEDRCGTIAPIDPR
jgi:amidase